MITTIDIPAKCLEHLRSGEFDKALLLAELMGGLEFSAELGDEGWIVAAGPTGILYEYCEDEQEARILALWHSLDENITFEDIVINAMGKHYINGVWVNKPESEA